ncbi:MAG: amidohydrolase family protein, partial [Planctomycetota bacterium]
MNKAQRIRINGAHVALPTGIAQTDVLIHGKTIAQIGIPAGSPYDESVDASGLLLMPGVVDTHVHFREPGLTHKEDLRTGTRAAAKGGVTTIVEMPNTVPPAVTVEGIRHKLKLGSEQCVTNYGFYIAATHDNIEELKNADGVALGIK